MGIRPAPELTQKWVNVTVRHFAHGADRSRLLVRVLRQLGQGEPISSEQVDGIATELAMPRDDARAFLRTVTERDAEDRIVGAFGLSLNEYPHRFVVNGTRLWTWCALDTLALPIILAHTATVESPSPANGQTVRLRVGPQGVEEVHPIDAVVSMIVIDPEAAHLNSVEATWGTFCHHIFFFTSRQEAVQWAAGRADIELLSIAEGYELARLCALALLTRAAEHSEPYGGKA